MIKKKKGIILGWIFMIFGFIIIILNAIVYLFNLGFSFPWLSLIGLLFVIVGLKLLRVSLEKK